MMTLVWLIQLLMMGGDTLLWVLPRILVRDEISPTMAGVIMGVFDLTALIGLLYSGAIIRRLGPRASLLVGAIVSVAGCLLYLGGPHHTGMYLIGRGLHGFGAALIGLTTQSLVMLMAGTHERGRTLGLANAPNYGMIAVTPFIGELMACVEWETGMFLLVAMISAVPAVLSLLLRAPVPADELSGSVGPGVSYRKYLVLFFCTVNGFVIGASRFILPLITVQGAAWSFSAFFLAYGSVGFLSRIAVEPVLSPHLAPTGMMAFACILSMATMLMAAAEHWTGFMFLGALFGLGKGVFYPMMVQQITADVARAKLMLRVGRLQAAVVIGSACAAPVAGVAAAHLTIRAAAMTIGAMGLGLQIIILILFAYPSAVAEKRPQFMEVKDT